MPGWAKVVIFILKDLGVKKTHFEQRNYVAQILETEIRFEDFLQIR